MNERVITMKAVQLLGQVAEALFGQVAKGVPDAARIIEAGVCCVQHAKQIAQFDCEAIDMEFRMVNVVTSLEWLVIIIRQFDNHLAGLQAENIGSEEIEKVSIAACLLAEGVQA